jgi:hypothetical protein
LTHWVFDFSLKISPSASVRRGCKRFERDALREITGGTLGIVLDGVLGGASIFEVREMNEKRNDFTYQA